MKAALILGVLVAGSIPPTPPPNAVALTQFGCVSTGGHLYLRGKVQSTNLGGTVVRFSGAYCETVIPDSTGAFSVRIPDSSTGQVSAQAELGGLKSNVMTDYIFGLRPPIALADSVTPVE